MSISSGDFGERREPRILNDALPEIERPELAKSGQWTLKTVAQAGATCVAAGIAIYSLATACLEMISRSPAASYRVSAIASSIIKLREPDSVAKIGHFQIGGWMAEHTKDQFEEHYTLSALGVGKKHTDLMIDCTDTKGMTLTILTGNAGGKYIAPWAIVKVDNNAPVPLLAEPDFVGGMTVIPHAERLNEEILTGKRVAIRLKQRRGNDDLTFDLDPKISEGRDAVNWVCPPR